MKTYTMNPFQIALGEPANPQINHVELVKKIRTILPGYDQLPTSEIRGDVLLLSDGSTPKASRRLVVLVPRGKYSESTLAQRIWRLASASDLGVLYLTLSPDEEQIPYYRREMTDLAMLTSDRKIRAYTSVSSGESWIDFVQKVLQPGDLLVCMSNHMVTRNLFQHRKLGEELFQFGKAPVYMLSGFKIGPPPEWEFMFKDVLAWVASLLLIIAFFGLDASIDHATSGLLSRILIVLSIIAEFVLLLKVNDWISKP